ncbi:MAG: DUF1015 domain-containing protein [Syntrophomonadaceae bacterium]|nr:DUF1015 domain-containing protein [Syntrophomonadaceae bacterium]
MTRIIPFKGLRYNPDKTADLADVVTPPYDIIDDVAQARYYANHPANIIRLELGLTFPQDTADNNRYTRAAQYLAKWMEDGTLKNDVKPALYLYQQEFMFKGQKKQRNGFVAGVKVEPYEKGNILPHEETLSKPKADRLQLMHATKSNFSSIFALYADQPKLIDNLLLTEAKGRHPDIEIVDEANEIHRIWVIDNADIINRIVEIMSDKKIYIADGHHRYETALEYAKQMAEQGIADYDYVMTTLVNLYDEGLVVLPTHRVVGHVDNFDFAVFVKQLTALFDVDKYPAQSDLIFIMHDLAVRGQNQHAFVMYNGESFYLLSLKDEEKAFSLLPEQNSDAWKSLDVAVLDNLILDQMLGIGEAERRSQENLAYSRSEEWVKDKVDTKQYQLGFLINATKVQEIVNVAEAHDKMPQKSTYFYPKLITGLIINNLTIK